MNARREPIRYMPGKFPEQAVPQDEYDARVTQLEDEQAEIDAEAVDGPDPVGVILVLCIGTVGAVCGLSVASIALAGVCR